MHEVLTNLFQGSPIIIGGGSVNISFDHDAYQPVAVGVFVKDDDELIALYVVDLKGIPIGSDLTRYVEDKNCAVTIRTFNEKGVESDLLVTSHPETNDRPGEIQVSFEVRDFPQADAQTHHSDHYTLSPRLEILNRDSGETVEPPLAQDGRCIITFVNKKPAFIG